MIEFTARPRDLALPEGELSGARVDLATLSKGQLVAGFIQSVKYNALWVTLSPTVRGRVFVLDVSDDLEVLQSLSGECCCCCVLFWSVGATKLTRCLHTVEHYKPGQPVQCVVMAIDSERGSLDLSIKAAAASLLNRRSTRRKKKKKDVQQVDTRIKDGSVIVGRVAK